MTPRSARVGVVTALWRYPVKSMAGEVLAAADVVWAGFAGDRRWGFLRADSAGSGFPWHTIRENPAMLRYTPRLVEPDRPDRSTIEVTTPDGAVLALGDGTLADALGTGVRLIRLDRGVFDDSPVSLIGAPTAARLCELAGVPRDVRRFRPNIVVEPKSGQPFVEDDWVGRTVRVGAAVIRLDQRDSRCTIIDVDPATGRPARGVLKTVGRERHACAGVYGSTVVPGRVAVGDVVTLLADDPVEDEPADVVSAPGGD